MGFGKMERKNSFIILMIKGLMKGVSKNGFAPDNYYGVLIMLTDVNQGSNKCGLKTEN